MRSLYTVYVTSRVIHSNKKARIVDSKRIGIEGKKNTLNNFIVRQMKKRELCNITQ